MQNLEVFFFILGNLRFLRSRTTHSQGRIELRKALENDRMRLINAVAYIVQEFS